MEYLQVHAGCMFVIMVVPIIYPHCQNLKLAFMGALGSRRRYFGYLYSVEVSEIFPGNDIAVCLGFLISLG